ncbi:amino acid adenylation domain-containing protein [Streptomyces sp. NPDC001700]
MTTLSDGPATEATGLAHGVHLRARLTPDALALVDQDRRFGYAALNTAGGQVAAALRGHGVRPGDAVAVGLPRSWQLVVVVLGALRLGARVVPLDTQSPPERQAHILTDSGSVVLVHGATPPEGIPDTVRPLPAARLLDALADRATSVDTFPERPAGLVLYTSGTTGRPKGVELPEAGVMRMARPGWLPLEPGARFACLSNPAFDAINFEMWTPLLTGGCCVVLRDEDVQSPHRLAATLLRERIDTLFVTTALFQAVVDTVPACFAGARQVLVGGEQLNPAVVRRWYRHNPSGATVLHNIYGPTEVCTFSLVHPIPRDFDADVVPIGRPLPDTGALLVVPGSERVAEPGEVAELLLSGPGVATGYRNLPEETARRFVRLDWYDGGRERYYRTGDLVRADADGVISYRGRADRQVKVRGFRIEPAEVERRIAAHPAVRQAYVCTREHPETAGHELLAYLVAGAELDFEEFDRHLTSAVPAYMRPHRVYRVDALPLTGNGKVDRAALLRRADRPWQRSADADAGPAAVATARQREVLELAEAVLGTSALRPTDRWISSGGDSLRALRLRFEIRRRWGCELGQAEVLHADFAAIAEAIDQASTGTGAGPRYPVPGPPSGAVRGPATSEQQRLWLHHQRFPGSRGYTVGQALRLDGPVDGAALRRALCGLVARHPALRTGFEVSPDGLLQVVGAPYAPWAEPEAVALVGEEDVSAFADRFFAEPHDLARPQMFAACWLPDADGGTLLLRLHHIAVDGWSLTVLFRDLSTAYAQALTAPDTTLPGSSPAPTPLDHAAWQTRWFATTGYEALRTGLRERWTAEEEPDEPLRPVRDRPYPEGRLLHTALDPDHRATVDRLCRELELSRFELLLGVFAWSLYAVTGRTRPRIATPVAGRPVQEFESSVGMFANTALLPVAVAPRGELRAELLRLGAAVRDTLEWQDVSLADVLDDRGHPAGHSPFDVLFVLENTDFGALELPGISARPVWRAPAEAKVPLTVSLVEHPDGFDCLWEYAADHFAADEIEAMDRLFRTGLDLLATGRSGTPAEVAAPHRRGLPEFGRGGEPSGGWATVAEGFAAQVARTPDAPALMTADGPVGYAQLDRWAAALAGELLAAHPLAADGERQRPVALYLEPSVEHVVALLALARLNWTAVPLDPAYPAEPLRQILRQVDPVCVLLAPGGEAAYDEVAYDGVDTGGGTVRRTITLAEGEPDTALPPPHAGRPLYTLFTSGSTGTPKGVQVFDHTLTNLLHWQASEGGLGTPAVTQQFSMLSFDVSFQEIFTTLCGGGTLHLMRPGWRQDIPALLDQLESAGVERVFMPYVALQLLAEHAVHLGRYPSRLREVVTAGEQLVCTDAIRRWFAGLPGARLFNHYGPTETHVVSALCLAGDPAHWPERPAIGTPVAGALLRVVDPAGEPLPPGCVGDLLIGGTMVSRCYLGDGTLNRERFTELPGADGLFYRSGDRAAFGHDGLLHHHGRDDQQIKLSGHRLELGQVEAALLRHPQVAGAVVVAEGGGLTACLEWRGDAPSARELDGHLAPLLPPHVRVDRFRRLESLPRTPSGKLDRRAAPRAPGEELRRGPADGQRLSEREAELTAAFKAVTGVPIGPDQTFFEAGASSLGLMRFHLRCTTALGVRFGIADLFEHVTVRALARFLDGTAPGPAYAAARPAEVAGPVHTAGHEPIAVVGMAVRVAGAPDLRAFWELTRSGGRGIEYFDAPDGLVGARSQMDGLLDFDPEHFGISRQEARLMDPQQRHTLMTCVEALAHAGIADTSALRVGLVAGAGENTYFQAMLRQSGPDRLPDGFQLALHHEKDFLATKAAYHLDLTGPAFSVQAACASSLFAVHMAAGLLRQGDADVMLAGGVLVDTGLSDGYRYKPQHIFSVDGHCRPFSDDATGTVGSSGVGMLVLKPLRLAREAGDTVYALVTGSAVNNDGSDKLGYSAPSLSGQREVIRTALRRSGRTGADLGYVEAHGTSTRLGDPVEVGALRQAFEVAESGRTALSSVKSQIGHLGAAAGVVGLVRAALCVHHGLIPPTLDFRTLNPQLGPDPTPFYVPTEALPWPADRPRVAAVSSFGIGGANAHAVIEAGEPGRPVEAPPCLLLSASSEAALRADADRIAAYLAERPEAYPAVLRHLQAGRPDRRWRMGAVCPDPASAVRWLRTASGVEVEPGTEPVPVADRDAPRLVADWLAGERIDWPTGPAQAPWDFPPPSFARAEYAMARAADGTTPGRIAPTVAVPGVAASPGTAATGAIPGIAAPPGAGPTRTAAPVAAPPGAEPTEGATTVSAPPGAATTVATTPGTATAVAASAGTATTGAATTVATTPGTATAVAASAGTATTGAATTGATPTRTATTVAAPPGAASTSAESPGAAATVATSTGTATTGAASPRAVATGVAPTEAATTGAAPTGTAATEGAATVAAPPGAASPGAAPPGTPTAVSAPTDAAPPGAVATGVAPTEAATTGAARTGTAATVAAPPGAASPGAESAEGVTAVAASPRAATTGVAPTEAELTKAAWPARVAEEQWLHQPHWVRFRRAGATGPAAASRPLVLVTDGPADPEEVRALRSVRSRVVLVAAGGGFARRNDDSYLVDPADPASLGALLDALDGLGAVDWLHALPLGVTGPVDGDRLDRARWACLDAPAALIRAAAGRTGLTPRPVWLSHRARPVDGPVDRPELALLAGVTEVAPQEGAAAGLWVDLPAAAPTGWAAPLAALLATDEQPPTHLALRHGYWWRQDTVALPAPSEHPVVPAAPDTVHLVLGGTGGIGATIAGWLLERTAGRVLLLARRPELPDALTPWADRIELVEADLTAHSPDRLAAVVADRTGRLDTVVHAAGAGAGGLIARRDPAVARAGSLAKLHGALLVERLVERFRPPLAVYCSSMAGTLGGVGQLDYAASAGVLDAFAHHEPPTPGGGGATLRLAIGWDVWREAGMALRAPAADVRHQAHLAVGLTLEEGRRTLARALAAQLPQVLVSTTELTTSRAFYAGPAPAPDAEPVEYVDEPAVLLGDWLCEWLGLDTLDRDASLYDLGADSLTLLDLIGEMKRHFDVELDLAELSHQVSLTEVLTLLDRERGGTAGAADVVTLDVWQQGAGTEVLCLVHPVGGDIQAYRALVAGIDPRLTVALIADPALRRPGGPEWTIGERARHYHAALEARFPAAGWHRQLAGWSFGAWVAVGMAAEAEAAGRPVDALHLLDPPPPGSGPLYQTYGEGELRTLFAHELGLGESGDGPDGEAAREYADRLTRCCLANLRAMADHRPPPLTTTPARVWLARLPVAGLPPLGSPGEQRELWRAQLAAPSDWHEVETTHYGLVRPPHVAAVTAEVNAVHRAVADQR